MDPSVREWLHIAFRWMHLIAGIMWIGNSLFFNWLDRHILRPPESKAGVEGELWMVHSGGFYQVEKKLVAPDQLPKVLHWFKWEAGFTWLSGFMLLGLLYYMGGGAYLLDPAVSSISLGAATALGLGLLVVAVPVYDLLVRSPLGQRGGLFAAVGYAAVLGVTYGLTRVLSGRAAFLHVGAMMGTLMAANVWMRIIPAQRHLVAAVQAGRRPDSARAEAAKQRSIHNNYMTFPLLFIMLSNHFPSVYGHPHNWLLLGAIMLVGAGIRHYLNVGDRSPMLLLALIGASVPAAMAASMVLRGASQPEQALAAAGPASPVASALAGQSTGGPPAPPARLDRGQLGTIRGVVRLDGPAPARKPVVLPAGCVEQHDPVRGPVLENTVLVKDGRLQNAFITISEGLAAWTDPPPQAEVTIDQRGCIYEPRVVGAMVGQPVTFLNSDPVVHNVRTVAQSNAVFNEIMVNRDSRLTKRFDKPEMVHTKCDIHPWMGAYIGVVAHPYFAVSNQEGEFALQHVPAGDYTLTAWHEVYGQLSQKVTVPAGGAARLELTFQPK